MPFPFNSYGTAVVFICTWLSTSVLALEFPSPEPGNNLIGTTRIVETKYKDTFADLGTANDLGYLEMVAANPGIDPWLPGNATKVVLPTHYILPSGPREGIVINLAEYRLYYYPKDKNIVYTYPLGIGREGWGSPIANTRITAKISNPAWYPPKSIREEHAAEGDFLPAIVPPGPDNPLGPYKLTLSLSGYLIHGSNKKFGIGMRVSHGCFRMLNPNVIELASMAPVGTPVRIINEPYKFGISNGDVYLEAHTPLDDQGNLSVVDKHTEVINILLKQEDLQNMRLDWDKVRRVVAEETGLPAVIGTIDDQTEKPAVQPFDPLY